jgi:two-component system response regulator DesR
LGGLVIRVVLGHRGALVRGALAAVLQREDDLDVVAELENADDVLTVAVREQPHVVVLDPRVTDPVDLGEVCRSLPARGVLVLVDREAVPNASLELAKQAPRVGLLATDSSPAELVDAVRHIARGKPVLDPGLAVAALTADENPLTCREQEVLRLATTGATTQEIARVLSLSAGTVRNYLSRILAKTGARTRIEAIRIAQEAGWI